MAAVRTLTGLGTILSQQIPGLTRVAQGHLTASKSVGRAETARALEGLLDRVCLSLTLAKPVGLSTWAERESPRIGRAGVVDLMNGATQAVASAAIAVHAETHRVLAFLNVLTNEVEDAVTGGPSKHPDAVIDEHAQALLAMLSERDNGTCCHSKATAEWARRLARVLDCDDERVDFIALCALLHDVGKIATPDTVLLKPGGLDEREWDLMREHAAAGARILNAIPSLQPCAPIVRAHHERYDGTGYPDRLAGTAIPFEARVVAVADAFHAMLSDRPYRRAVSPRIALKILEEGRGTQWDPDVVDAMTGMFVRHITPHAPSKVSSA